MTPDDWFEILGIAAGMVLSMRSLVHYFQLESYQFPGYFRTLKRNVRRALLPGTLQAAWAGIMTLLVMAMGNGVVAKLLYMVLTVVAGFGIYRTLKDKKAKKPLHMTLRVKRLYAMAAVVFLLLSWGTAACFGAQWLWAVPLLLPIWTALAGLLAWPIEKLISEMYFRDAQRRLKERPDLIKIGITGSYGKTSVKFILGTLLSEKYQTLVTLPALIRPWELPKSSALSCSLPIRFLWRRWVPGTWGILRKCAAWCIRPMAC